MKFLSAAILSAFLLTAAPGVWAATPEPKSEGRFFPNKGTKAEEEFEGQGRAGAIYQFGKGVNIGNLVIKPVAAYVHEWVNNVFFQENGRKEDHIHRLNAGFDAELPLNGDQHLLSFSYLSEIEWFERFDRENHDDHSFRGMADLHFVPFSLEMDHTFRKTTSRADTEFTDRTKRDENETHALLEVPFASFFLESEMLNLYTDYQDEANSVFDHNEFNFYQRVGYDLGPHTQLMAEYGNIWLDYNHDAGNDRDGDANQAMLGVRGSLATRISYQLWGGAQWRIYDENTRPDFHGFVFRSALQYDISEASSLLLKASRSPQESTFDDQSFYVRNRLELRWRQRLAEKLFFINRELLDYNEYSRITERDNTGRTRRDYVWESVLGLEYYVIGENLSVYGEYSYQARDSNIRNLDYDAQSVSAGVKAKF